MKSILPSLSSTLVLPMLWACAPGLQGVDVGGFHFGYTRSRCDRAVKYNGNHISLSGFELPFISHGVAKIGRLEVTPVTLQTASERIQALDLEQSALCQSALMITQDSTRARF